MRTHLKIFVGALLLYLPLFTFNYLDIINLDRGFYYPENKILFLNIPKNGSSFIRNSLPGPYEAVFLPSITPETITVLVVRDPYTRIVSSYFEMIKAREDGPEQTIHEEFYLYQEDLVESFEQFMFTIQNNFYDEHCIPQSSYHKDVALEDIDFIINFSSLESDLLNFSKIYQIPLEQSECRNESKREPAKILHQYIQSNEHVRAAINYIYEVDFIYYDICLKKRNAILNAISNP